MSQERKKRMKLLKKLLEIIEAGKFDSSPPQNLDNISPRHEYISPFERSSYNYGYMNINEIGAGTPNTYE